MNNKSLARKIGFCVVLIFTQSVESQAALVTSSAGFTDALVIDFSQFSGALLFTTGPIQVGNLVSENVVYSSTGNSVVGDVSPPAQYGLASNAGWDDGRVGFVGIDSEIDTIRFDFNDGPVSEVGGFVNYNPDVTSSFTISAIASNNSILETYIVSTLEPISTNGVRNAGAFRGISRASEDIAAFSITGAFGVLDDLTFGPRQAVAVPEPSIVALMGMMSGFALCRRRMRRE